MRGEPGNKAKSQAFTVLYRSSCAKPSKIYACENLQCSWTAWLACYCSCFPASFKQFCLNFIYSQVWYERSFAEIFTLKINRCVCTVETYNTSVVLVWESIRLLRVFLPGWYYVCLVSMEVPLNSLIPRPQLGMVHALYTVPRVLEWNYVPCQGIYWLKCFTIKLTPCSISPKEFLTDDT